MAIFLVRKVGIVIGRHVSAREDSAEGRSDLRRADRRLQDRPRRWTARVRRIFRIAEGDDPSDLPFDEQIAAFEAEHNVGPHDLLIVIRFEGERQCLA